MSQNLVVRMVRVATPALALCLVAAPRASAQSVLTSTDRALSFRYIGPPGNKVVAVAGVPGDPDVVFAGTPSGGVFKSDDGGVHWRAVFDSQTVTSIGAIAVARSDPKVVWVGTGDSFIRENVSIGNGVYRSTDAGETWTHAGLDSTGRIGRVAIDPRNPNVVFVAAMGTGYGPSEHRGVYRTRDGGKTWERVLFVDRSTGAIDVVIDPSNPQVMFAAAWQLSMGPGGNEAGGPGSGIYVSRDHGTTWTKLAKGLPAGPLGKIGLAIAPSNPRRVYALIATPRRGDGNLWRSDDSGVNWKLISSDDRVNTRPMYFSRMAVSSDNPDEAFFLTQQAWMTHDGGSTLEVVRGIYVDHHDIWIDPTNARRIIVANDRYVNFSHNRGKSWYHVDLPNGQLYRVAVDRRVPYNVYGNRHDGPGFRGPSNARTSTTSGVAGRSELTGQIDGDLWEWIAGTEVGWSVPDPDDDNFVWSMDAGSVRVTDMRSGASRAVTPWPRGNPNQAPTGEAGRYRLGGGFAFAISPHQPRKVYAGSQFLHQTLDRGRTWSIISPDLTANALRAPAGPWPDGRVSSALFSIAESPVERGQVWTGSTDGVLQMTRDGGLSWRNVSAGLAGLPGLCTISSIEPSRHDRASAYVTVDCHRVDDRNPYVFKTADYGASWTAISATLPRVPNGYARVIREDPVRRGLLYLGTESGLYLSVDDGATWTRFHHRLPPAPVSWITVQEDFNDLVISTFGRGFWILDDIAPLQQLTPAVAAMDSYLFTPPNAYLYAVRWPKTAQAIATEFDPPTNTGVSPPFGAPLSYYLKSAEPGKVKLTVVDQEGKTVRVLDGPGDAGVNRIWWDLRGETPAPAAAPASGGRREPAAPLVAPGTYTIKISIRGTERTTRLVVLADPAETGK